MVKRVWRTLIHKSIHLSMKLSPLLYILLIISTLFGCKDSFKSQRKQAFLSETGNSQLIEINFDYDTDCLPFDSLANDVFFIKLETTGNSLIGEISQILFTSDKIIVVDREIAKTICVFDKSGKFLNNIGRLGEGPEEYIDIRHIALSNDSSMIVINNNTDQLKYYTLSGKFVKNKKMPYRLDGFEFLTEQLIISEFFLGNNVDNNNQYNPRFLVSDLSGGIIYSAFQSYYKKEFTFSTQSSLWKYGDNIFYNPSYTDTIYCVTPEGLYARYVFKMEKAKSLVIDQNTTDAILLDHHEKYPFFNGDFIDLKDAVYVRFMEARSTWDKFALYSKKQDRSFCCTGDLFNPFFYFWLTPKTRYEDNYLVSYAHAANIVQRKEDMYRLAVNLPAEKKGMLDKLYNDFTEDDNPVLFFYRVNI